MTQLMQASHQWATRPADQRYTSLIAMRDFLAEQRANSRALGISSRKLKAEPDGNRGLVVTGPNGHAYAPTHFSFGQLAARAGAPPGYLRRLPAPMSADCINYGLQYLRDIEEWDGHELRRFLADKFEDSSITMRTGTRDASYRRRLREYRHTLAERGL